jgi:hypothetical protein
MKYCSTEARKIIDVIGEYGLELPNKEYFKVEMAAGTWWPNHIEQVIRQVMKSGDPTARLNAATAGGFGYYMKPIESMLTSRQGAFRNTRIFIEDIRETRAVYDAVTESLCLVDFNLDELRLLTSEIPLMIGNDILFLSRSIDACKRASARSVFYLHGVIRREYQTNRGKSKETQEQAAESAESAWSPPEEFDTLDVVDRRILKNDWEDRINSIKIRRNLNDV